MGVHWQRGRMRALSIGFSTPSTFEGATISLECTHWFDGDRLESSHWATNVMYDDGSSRWVDHPGADNVQDSLESMIAMLVPFYDGKSLWKHHETDREFTFWEMIVRSLPENLL
jgi:hypothetical protein